MCSQKCDNTEGSFTCSCDKGYSLDPVDKKTCRAEGKFLQLCWLMKSLFCDSSTYEM